MDNILKFTNVNKSFGDFALKDVTFRLPRGFIMGFIGHNGAGKTTTIKLLLNMLKKDSGDIKIFGRDNVCHEIAIKEKIGIVMDEPFYVEDWTLSDVEKALSPFYRAWDHEKFRTYLGEFSLDAKKKVKELSRGMKMKLMIACALSHDAELLILDEPTSGLDAVSRTDLMEILSTFVQDERRSVLFSTHITADLEKIADFITFINQGQILYSDTKDNLMEKYVVVKGGLNILTEQQKRLIIGYAEHNVGFDGIIDSAQRNQLPKSVILERCTLDEIVVRFNMRGGKHND